jgi:hypothetical protein
MDFIAGNLGLNSNLKIIDNQPIRLDYADFDKNGSIDPIFSKYEQGQYYPISSLDQLEKQLPSIKKKFRYYNTFANSSTEDLIDLFKTKSYNTLEAHELKSSYIENLGNNQFRISALPLQTQIAPIHGILNKDVNQDGYLDVLLVGNNYGTEVGMGRYDASIGHVLMNDGKGNFNESSFQETGFVVKGDSRSIINVTTPSKDLILVGSNNEEVKSFSFQKDYNKQIQPYPKERYAILKFDDSKSQKVEFSLGGGYLSQSSNTINISENILSIEFYNFLGQLTRELNF